MLKWEIICHGQSAFGLGGKLIKECSVSGTDQRRCNQIFRDLGAKQNGAYAHIGDKGIVYDRQHRKPWSATSLRQQRYHFFSLSTDVVFQELVHLEREKKW
jgi:hypothetical protein